MINGTQEVIELLGQKIHTLTSDLDFEKFLRRQSEEKVEVLEKEIATLKAKLSEVSK